MRYLGRDDSQVVVKCGRCKKIHVYNRDDYKNHFDKKCAECGSKCRFVWMNPINISKVKSYMPLLIMTILLFSSLVIINVSFFTESYFFNKAVTALDPMVVSILVPILCALITIIPIKCTDKSNNTIVEKVKGNHLQIICILIEFLIFVVSLKIVIGIKYCSLQISTPETGETMQYFGSAIGKQASGKGRLFNSEGELIYIGEFKNNLYDGYGKKREKITSVHETDISGTYQWVYEGYFKDGVPNGNGSEYRYDEKYDFEKGKDCLPYLRYEGEFVEGKYCGTGILYDITTKYEGVFFDGKYNGYGKLWERVSDSKQTYKYEGVFVDGKMNGAVKKYNADASIYCDGVYKDDSFISGSIFYENGNIMYKGGWNGSYHGNGILYWDNSKKRYDGEWKNGKRDGYGSSYREDGTLEYIGYWKEDLYETNYGELYNEDGKTIYYKGGYSSGQKSGDGTSYRLDGEKEYEGSWKSGRWNGKGIWYWENGKVYYEGDFIDGQPEGKGVSYQSNGKIRYKGSWSKGEYSGQGILYDENEKIEYNGEFVEGEYIEDSENK